MAIPEERYCSICRGYVDTAFPSGMQVQHRDLTDCLKELLRRIDEHERSYHGRQD